MNFAWSLATPRSRSHNLTETRWPYLAVWLSAIDQALLEFTAMIRRVFMTALITLGATVAMTFHTASAKENEATSAGKLLRHVVLFKFKDDVEPAQIDEVVEAFRQLPKQIDTIEGFEWGTNVSPENKAAGFTHCFFLTFRDDTGRDAYLPHPAHKAFGTLVGPKLDKVLVFDYWTEK
jgi:hypothetical protein